MVFTDADLAYGPTQAAALVHKVEEGYDVVVGSRRHTDTTTLVRAGRLREVGGRLVNLTTHALLLGQYRDTQCGLKAFRSDVARPLFEASTLDGFAFDVELFHLVERWRLSLAEVPVEVENSERSTVQLLRDGIRLVVDLIRVRQRARNGDYPEAPAPRQRSSRLPFLRNMTSVDRCPRSGTRMCPRPSDVGSPIWCVVGNLTPRAL